MLLDGGTAVDAAIAGMFCNGVYSSQVKDIRLMDVLDTKTKENAMTIIFFTYFGLLY